MNTRPDDLLAEWDPLACRLARRFGHSADREDLEQVARFALWQAAQRFDPAHGCKFYTFAMPTIVGALRRYIREQGRACGIARRWWELRPQVEQAAAVLNGRSGGGASVAELAAYLAVSEEDVVNAMAVKDLERPLSLDAPLPGPDGTGNSTLGDQLATTDPRLASAELCVVVGEAMDALAPELRQIVQLRYFQNEPTTMVARMLRRSQKHVLRLERRALAHLRQALREAFAAGIS